MIRFTDEEILDRMLDYHGSILLLAPLVKGRKGHYRELFESVMKQGYVGPGLTVSSSSSNRDAPRSVQGARHRSGYRPLGSSPR